MTRITAKTVSMISMILFFLVSNSFAMEASPKGTKVIPFEVTQQDSAFIKVIDVESRTVSGQEEIVVGVVVKGFSDVFKAGFQGKEETAYEVSYYSPQWNQPIDDGAPQFVWWESDAKSSTHVFKMIRVSNSNQFIITYDDHFSLKIKIK